MKTGTSSITSQQVYDGGKNPCPIQFLAPKRIGILYKLCSRLLLGLYLVTQREEI